MELTFENQHVVAVVVFMVALLFCKNVLELAAAGLQLWQTCGCAACAACDCLACDHGAQERLRTLGAAVLLFFSVSQPVLLFVVKGAADALRRREGFWTVHLVRADFNASAFPHKRARAENASAPDPATAVRLAASEVDGLLLVMPFALCAASTTYTWASLRASGHFAGDPAWDAELFADRRMQLYELLYALELCLMLLALLVLAADPAPLEHALAVAALAAFILLFFGAQSRCAGGDRAEGFLGMLLFATLNCLLSAFVAEHAPARPVQLCAAAVLALSALLLAGLHMTATADARAGDVILGRTVLSCASSAFFAVLLAVDANSL